NFFLGRSCDRNIHATKPLSMKSFKTKLKVNNQQKTILALSAGVARHAYNWGLATCISDYQETKKRPSAITLHKRLVAEVKPINPWYYEVSKCAPRASIKRFRKGIQKLFNYSGTWISEI
ncbi:helix-turn-helix domain-containing protein, partial [Dapis sp. BLCC M172]|uniref:helix-turn-helix domain-containing protein n=1 Tax=Dapis sp. BLCC M172 TaxID=2975281 RepID=UPI003CF237A2